MRTTITIDDAVVADLMKFAKTRNPAAAIRHAVEEHTRRKKFEDILKLAGENLLADGYTNESLEEEELRDARRYEH